MRIIRISLAAVFMFTSAQAMAGVEQNSVITFRDSPTRAIRVVRTEESRILFFECDNVPTGAGPALNNCSTIGREGGYSVAEIESRGKKLRALKWVKNLSVLTLGIACSALLAGAAGSLQMMNSFEHVNSLNRGDHVENAFAALEMAPVEATMIVVAAMAYGATGAVGGLVGGLFANKYVLPNLRQGANAMFFASRKADVPNIAINGPIDKYRDYLESALNGVPALKPAP